MEPKKPPFEGFGVLDFHVRLEKYAAVRGVNGGNANHLAAFGSSKGWEPSRNHHLTVPPAYLPVQLNLLQTLAARCLQT